MDDTRDAPSDGMRPSKFVITPTPPLLQSRIFIWAHRYTVETAVYTAGYIIAQGLVSASDTGISELLASSLSVAETVCLRERGCCGEMQASPERSDLSSPEVVAVGRSYRFRSGQ